MAVSLGKRKRSQPPGVKVEPGSGSEDEQSLKEIFQKHFEAKFRPLKSDGGAAKHENQESEGAVYGLDDEDAESGNDWSGFSNDEEVAAPVVKHVELVRDAKAEVSKQELRAFLSSKVPLAKLKSPEDSEKSRKKKGDSAEDGDGDEDSSINLKNDLALQRLLSESHLLSKDKSTTGALGPTGKSRHKALDLRIQALGSKDSVFAQQNVPMHIRKGIARKQGEREQKRRREAKDAGIILEREVRASKTGSSRRRDRGVAGPAVGRFKRGMLTLNRNDINDIQSTRSHGPRRR